MALILKGFAEIGSLVNNTTGRVSAIGEMTALSQTYATESRKYHHNDAALGDVLFRSFYSYNNTSNQLVAPNSTHTATILRVTNWLASRAKALLLPNELAALRNQITNEFSGLTDVDCGGYVSEGSYKLPSWISFKSNGGNHISKVWFADVNFRNEYDEFEIIVVPPVDTMDTMFEPSNVLEPLMKAYTPVVINEKLITLAGNNPPTAQKIYEHNRISALAPTAIPTFWSVLVYGRYGEDLDVINEAIIAHILANSTRTREQWKVILPSLFINTEFIIAPLYRRIAVPNQETHAGVYSPFVKNSDVEQMITLIDPTNAAWIRQRVVSAASAYRSLAFCAWGGNENIDGITDLSVKWPQYINVPTTSADFARMSPETQGFSNVLHDLLAAADTMTTSSDLPAGISRSTRNGKIFATKRYGNAQYRVFCKSNLNL